MSEMNAEGIDKAIGQLGVLLADEMTGLIVETMKQDFWKKYGRFDLMVAWDCFVDEVNRVNDVINLHDELCKYDKEDWESLINNDLDKIPPKIKEVWLDE